MKEKEISIVMGSDSDLSVMKSACEVLEKFGIDFEIRIISAHRTPEKLFSWISEINKSKCKIIIAAAGGAAHLPGVIASHTILPVIGIPIASSIDGLDALYSIVQMPNGIPVATVGIDRARNAALLAVSILALGNKELKNKLEEYRRKMQIENNNKDENLQKLGWEKYV